ncbi:hypothetical protein Tco_1316033 [Tanacetum coccineum]
MHKDLAFDDLDDIVDDAMDYMESKDAQDEGRTSYVVLEEKENADKKVSTKAPVSTVKPNEGTDKRDEGTDKQDGGTNSTKVSTDRQGEGTADHIEGKKKCLLTQLQQYTTSTPTLNYIWSEEIQECLRNWRRPKAHYFIIRSILTLRPLPKINPKDKGKKRIEEEDESDTESEDITEAEKKFKQLANDEVVARKERLNAARILPEKASREERVIIKRSDDSFIAIGSAEDEKMIKEMNEQAIDASKNGAGLKILDCTAKFGDSELVGKLLELKLETEEDSTMALELIRFVKKQIAELEPKDSDGDEKDP